MTKSIHLRIDEDIKAYLEKEAKLNYRTLQDEIRCRLEKSIKDDNNVKKQI